MGVDMSCGNNCQCNQIKIEEVDMPYGKQLKFAVGEDGVNEIGMLDEIYNSIMKVASDLAIEHTDMMYTSMSQFEANKHRVKRDAVVEFNKRIEYIFEKYRNK